MFMVLIAVYLKPRDNNYTIPAVYSFDWTSAGRRMRETGRLAANQSLMMKDDLFPNARYGLNGRKFKISTNMVIA